MSPEHTGGVARLDNCGRVDRTHSLSFTLDGKAFQGYAGDTLASALLAHGEHLVARSFKYHRPRGIHSEFWQHTLGCRRWLVVKRHTVTHDIESVVPAAQRSVA